MRSGGQVLAPQRVLPTQLQAPRSRGPWPLLVILHGLGVGPERYDQLAELGTGAGQLVARPSVPQEDPARGYPLDRSVLASAEAHDVTALLNAIGASAYGPHVDWSRVTVLGHSDGADAALSVGFDPAVRDRRVSRVVAMEADPLSFPPVHDGPWLLVVHGDHDELVPYADGRSVFAAMAGARTCMLTVVGGTHTDVAWGEHDGLLEAVDAAIVALLEQRQLGPSACPRNAQRDPRVVLEPAG